MARSEGRIRTSIWNDDDFRALSGAAQRAYFLVLSQPDLSFCGVLAYRPRRWARLAADTTARTLESTFRVLTAARFLLIDPDTEELLVRTFIKHDGVLKSPNLVMKMASDFEAVQSRPLRECILEGLGEGFLEGLPERFPKGFEKPLPEGFVKEFHERFPEGSACARAQSFDPSPLAVGHRPLTPDPSPDPSPPPLDAAGEGSPPTPAVPPESNGATNGAALPPQMADRIQRIMAMQRVPE